MSNKLASAENYYTKIIDTLGMNYTQLDRSTFRLDNDKVLIMRYSSFHETSKPHYWFGLQKEKFDIYPYKYLYVVFICGSDQRAFVIPATYLKELLEGVKTAADNSWKFNIYNDDYSYQLWVSGKPLLDITRYLNNYKQITAPTTRSPAPPKRKINNPIEEIQGNSLHEKTIEMIKQIGEWMRYKPVINYKLHPHISAIDIAWLLDDTLEIAIEVYQFNENISEIRMRLVLAKRFGARKCIVILNSEDKQKLLEFKNIFRYENEVKHYLEIWNLEKIYSMYISGNEFFKNFNAFHKPKYHEDIVEFI